MSNLKVFLVEDHETVREGIKMLVNSQSNMEVIGESGNGRDAVKQIEKLNPDVVLMDISMPELNGLKATKKLKQVCPKIKILTLTRHTDDGYLQQLLKAGVKGYVLKQSAPAQLINAIQVVSTGKSYLDPALTEKVMGGYIRQSTAISSANRVAITDREAFVLRQIAWGYSNKEIGVNMQISVKTVEAHKANAMRKLGIINRIGIVRYAILQGWLEDN